MNDCNEDLKELTSAVNMLVERTDTLIKLHRDIIKWLLIVVCVIALGRSAIDLMEGGYGRIIPEVKEVNVR